VASLQDGLLALFDAPDGYEVVLGNGGATAFWDAASFGLISEQSHHLVCGEFSSKFAAVARNAPQLKDPVVTETAPGQPVAHVQVAEGCDVYAFAQNETSTGVQTPVLRPDGFDGLVLVDAVSAAGGMPVDLSQADVYYCSPQKCFGADGGLFAAVMSPAAAERIETIKNSGRFIPAFLDLATALDNSRKNQTYNTPALATLYLFDSQVRWMNESGGLAWSAGRSKGLSDHLYNWADAHPLASPFVDDVASRSQTVATIDFADGIDAELLASILRSNGIVDTEPYRKLGRNQLRISCFPDIELTDMHKLTACIDAILDYLS
jgi:phosphoserine aminotransferase